MLGAIHARRPCLTDNENALSYAPREARTHDDAVMAMRMLQRRSRAGGPQRIAAAIVLLAFALLASIAASHLHVGADQDELCSLCAAFGAGKLEPPSPAAAVPVVASLTYFVRGVESPSQVSRTTPVVLPPSCGPPPGIA